MLFNKDMLLLRLLYKNQYKDFTAKRPRPKGDVFTILLAEKRV